MNSEYFRDLLKSRDLKVTSHRLNLLINMQEYSSAMPYSSIQESMKETDRVTLYRTLETLMEQGIIHRAFRDNNEVYYAICGNNCDKDQHQHNHIHFICNKCKFVTCQELSRSVKISIPHHEIEDVIIHVKGICKTCKGKSSANI